MSYDVALDKDGDLPIKTEHITGDELIAQRLRIGLNLWRGEYFLDTRRGLPFMDWKQNKPLDLDEVSSRIRSVIASTPGVEGVQTLDVSFDSGTLEVEGKITIAGQAAQITAEIGTAKDGNSQPALILLLD